LIRKIKKNFEGNSVPFYQQFLKFKDLADLLSGLVVRVPGYRSRGLGSIPGATRLSE
jgi:hypothetical protein